MAIHHVERLYAGIPARWSVFRDDGKGGDEYLHQDGKWHTSVASEDGQSFPGLFSDRESAREAVLLEALNADVEATICYEPRSGGLILLDKDEKRTELQPTMQEFTSLTRQNKIRHVGSVGQGHCVFRGIVDFYRPS